jgi:hypothetical protein
MRGGVRHRRGRTGLYCGCAISKPPYKPRYVDHPHLPIGIEEGLQPNACQKVVAGRGRFAKLDWHRTTHCAGRLVAYVLRRTAHGALLIMGELCGNPALESDGAYASRNRTQAVRRMSAQGQFLQSHVDMTPLHQRSTLATSGNPSEPHRSDMATKSSPTNADVPFNSTATNPRFSHCRHVDCKLPFETTPSRRASMHLLTNSGHSC